MHSHGSVSMKPLLAVLGIILGTAVVGLILTIQHDPYAFTTHEERIAMNLAPIQTLPIPQHIARAVIVVPANVVHIDEVTVEGRTSPPPKPKPSRRAAASVTGALPPVTIVPAP